MEDHALTSTDTLYLSSSTDAIMADFHIDRSFVVHVYLPPADEEGHPRRQRPVLLDSHRTFVLGRHISCRAAAEGEFRRPRRHLRVQAVRDGGHKFRTEPPG